MEFCFYRGRFIYTTQEYVSAYRNRFFNVIYDPKNRKKMLDEIEKIIDFNSSVDLYAYAQLLFDEGNKYGLSKAYSILDMLVSWNYTPAKYLLGQMYFFGMGTSKSISKFYSLTLEAANDGFIIAKNALALAYFNGYGCNIDYKKGHQLLQECVDNHYGMGYYNIGIGYLNGTFGYPKDAYQAFEYFKSASNQLHPGATYNLGIMYLSGTGCTKDVEKGLYELKSAAYSGHVKSQIKAADSYYFGKITPKNIELAYELYLMAAEAGDPYAMYSVGYIIVNKQKAWIEKSVGVAWLRKAADLGYEAAKQLLKQV